jgi:hypothetical protein
VHLAGWIDLKDGANGDPARADCNDTSARAIDRTLKQWTRLSFAILQLCLASRRFGAHEFWFARSSIILKPGTVSSTS